MSNVVVIHVNPVKKLNKTLYLFVLSVYFLTFASLILYVSLTFPDKRMAAILDFLLFLYPFVDLMTTNYLKDYFAPNKNKKKRNNKENRIDFWFYGI